MSYNFIRTLSKYYPSIKTYINLKIVPHTFTCHFCKRSDCIMEGKYCSVNYDFLSPITGQDVVKQQLREQIVSRDYQDEWWHYMKQFDEECDNLLNAQNCSAKIFKKLNINAEAI